MSFLEMAQWRQCVWQFSSKLLLIHWLTHWLTHFARTCPCREHPQNIINWHEKHCQENNYRVENLRTSPCKSVRHSKHVRHTKFAIERHKNRDTMLKSRKLNHTLDLQNKYFLNNLIMHWHNIHFYLPEIRSVRFIDTAHWKHGKTLGQHNDRPYRCIQTISRRVEGLRRGYNSRQHYKSRRLIK